MKRSPLKTKPKEKPDWQGLYHDRVHTDPPLTEKDKQVLQERRRRYKASKEARFARQFHSAEFVEWMQAKPCCGCGEPDRAKLSWEPCEVHHVNTRGAGGTWKDTAPLCRACHGEVHHRGRVTFCRERGWPLERLSELAAGYAAEWEARLEPGREPLPEGSR